MSGDVDYDAALRHQRELEMALDDARDADEVASQMSDEDVREALFWMRSAILTTCGCGGATLLAVGSVCVTVEEGCGPAM